MLLFGQLLCLIWILACGGISCLPSGDSYRTGERVNMTDANEIVHITRAIKAKLFKLNAIDEKNANSNDNFELMHLHSLTYRINVGIMYESVAEVKINGTARNCTIELWGMPWLHGDKFEMECKSVGNSGEQQYRLIDGGVQEMSSSSNELAELSKVFDATMRRHQRTDFNLTLKRIVNAQKIVVNGVIYLAHAELMLANGQVIECSAEAYYQPVSESDAFFNQLFIACEKDVYKLNMDDQRNDIDHKSVSN